jgi:hypothetical protein
MAVFVTPAKTGVQWLYVFENPWIPIFTGMTNLVLWIQACAGMTDKST